LKAKQRLTPDKARRCDAARALSTHATVSSFQQTTQKYTFDGQSYQHNDDARDTAESDRIFNQIEALRLAASYLTPTSNEGAQFQAELSGILADGMIGESRRKQFEAQRAIQRMGDALGAFLGASA
jgi:hypothetical protein